MTVAEIAEARSRAYRLFSAVFLRGGADRDVISGLSAIPELADIRPGSQDEGAAYHDLFGLNVYPYASVFLDPQARLGGGVSDWVIRWFQQIGMGVDATDTAPDHIGHELAALGFLQGAEADARLDHRTEKVRQLVDLQRAFLDRHLLGWMPAFVWAVQAQGDPFYAQLADLALALVVDHRQDMGGSVATELNLPETADQHEPNSIRELAVHLTQHARSGIYLSRKDIAALGRKERLPRGFGDRAQMLANLFRSAARFDQLPEVLDGLRGRVHDQNHRYEHLEQVPALGAMGRFWRARLAQTLCLLDTIQTAMVYETASDH